MRGRTGRSDGFCGNEMSEGWSTQKLRVYNCNLELFVCTKVFIAVVADVDGSH